MTAATFDTLEYSKTLQDAGVPQGQAEAIATAQSKALQEVINAQQFATKADLQAVESKLETKIAETKHELIKWLVGALLAQTALLMAIISFMK